ncbi:DUF6445 family protein [Gilvimarinus algae]|uniref:DUF6445 family protein n=1 Tax=Gilvimarinus algae TaxID=3058037 RepID=A0ABT8TDH5_9GAMM|nr:DUF6445 family protein [Gilvimarinus sp. SDUM040014]MDO3381990.1 DUF6445 family protein [Gilvimarinus sp. SDUM040014]
MTQMPPSANPKAQIQCVHIGKEQQPVLIIDDFLTAPEALIERACELDFAPEQKLYPGLRAEAPRAYTDAMEAMLPPLLARHFGTRAGDITRVESSFSLVTQAPHTLSPLQRLPHFDSRNRRELASIYFLCNQSSQRYGGTAFYRHRHTGYEAIDDGRFPRYAQSVEQHIQASGLPAADYIRGDTPLFEQIAAFPARYNRLLVYRCTSLHSGLIDESFDFSTDPRRARLSINTFLVN